MELHVYWQQEDRKVHITSNQVTNDEWLRFIRAIYLTACQMSLDQSLVRSIVACVDLVLSLFKTPSEVTKVVACLLVLRKQKQFGSISLSCVHDYL